MTVGRRTVLIVEDDADDVLFMERAFEKAGLGRPRSVEDGEAAVAYLAGTGAFADRRRYPLPDLVLLDLKLPRKSGHEVLAWMKSQSGIRRIPVVILTSSREIADVNRAFDLGASSYLTKPVDTTGLVEIAQAIRSYWFGLNRGPELPAPAGQEARAPGSPGP